MFRKSFYQENRKAFCEKMKADSLALFFSGWPVCRSGDADYPFSADNNFYYLTGIREPEVVLAFLKNQHGDVQVLLFIQKADPDKVKWVGNKITVEAAAEISGIGEIRYFDGFRNWLQSQKTAQIYLDSWAPEYQKIKMAEILSAVEDLPVEDSAPLLRELRNIKKEPEIEAVRKGIDLTSKGIEAVAAVLHPGIYEYQIQAIFEYIIVTGGAEGPAFGTIVASGVNGPILHYEDNKQQIGENTFVLLDLGARVSGYSSDISRTLFCGTKASREQLAVYESVLTAQKALIECYQPGTDMKSIQQRAKNILLEQAVQRGLVKKTASIDQIYYHGVGHPLGLDTHDLGRQENLILQPGMIVTCEPGLYFRDKGIGIRIEDDILITEQGPVNLSEKIPKELHFCS